MIGGRFTSAVGITVVPHHIFAPHSLPEPAGDDTVVRIYPSNPITQRNYMQGRRSREVTMVPVRSMH